MSEHGIKQTLALLKAFNASGFKLGNRSSHMGLDGLCWTACLSDGGRKLIVLHDEGNGGGVVIENAYDRKGSAPSEDVVNAAIDKLFAIPEVADYMREWDADLESMTWSYCVEREHRKHTEEGGTLSLGDFREKSRLDSEEKVRQIRTSPPRQNDDAVGIVIRAVFDAMDEARKLRAKCKVGLCWTIKGEPGNYMALKRPDSPELRAMAQKKYGDQIEAFIQDLLVGC